MRALVIVALLAAPAFADGFIASGRIGPAHVTDGDGDLDTPPDVWGVGGGIQLGYAVGRVMPAIAIDGAYITGASDDYISGPGTFHQFLFGVSAKLAVEVVDDLDVSVGLGYGQNREGPDFTSRGYRLELGAGYRVWHDGHNGVRLELNAVEYDLTNPGEGFKHTVEQYGASVAYEYRF